MTDHTPPLLTLSIRPGYPDFLDLPWESPLAEWRHVCKQRVEVPRGVSRHIVEFVNYEGALYALKELPPTVAEKEYDLLREMDESRLPVVRPVGHISIRNGERFSSVLITQFLDYSQPYRSILVGSPTNQFVENLLDAMAGLLVQLHLAGVFWGDCSLSNTLFRRDAGTLQAYLVDAETAEISPELAPTLRHDDLSIMEENINGDLADLAASRLLPSGFPVFTTGTSIRHRYQRLWDEITHEELIHPKERFRIQERIRALNKLGFSIGELEIRTEEGGEKLKMRVVVTDRNFHRDQLHGLTGLETEEKQAQKMMNEIRELQASLSIEQNRSAALSVAAFKWLEETYLPAVRQLKPLIDKNKADPAELYCNILEHKWYLSERAQRDVGHKAAIADYLKNFLTQTDELVETQEKPGTPSS
ncbi:MAG: DUF4032 domain-containing protein [Anaerolineales bacterium]|jgi:hypothetical protein